MRKGGGKNKGSQFERDICRQLSLWLTNGASDSVFWRTSNSGGRATTRSKKGKTTENQYGDICAIEEIGKKFLRLFTVEIKRGYNKHTVQDLFDLEDPSKSMYASWIEQAKESARLADTYWMIIIKRDRRQTVVLHNGADLSKENQSIIFTSLGFCRLTTLEYFLLSHEEDAASMREEANYKG